MMWKRIVLAVLGAGMMGAAASQSNAEAATCPSTCQGRPTDHCYCEDFQKEVVSATYWEVVAGQDSANAASFLRGKRQKVSGGTALQRRSMDYEVLQMGSTHHRGYAWIHCTGTMGDAWIDDLTTNDVGTISCPAGTTWMWGIIGLTMTSDVCPDSNWRCVPQN